MAKKLYEESNIQDIANAIREKNGTESTYKTSEMGNAIREIESGGGSGDNPLSYAVTLGSLFQGAIFPNGYILDLEVPNFNSSSVRVGSLGYAFYDSIGLKKIKLKLGHIDKSIPLDNAFRKSADLEEVDLCGDTIVVSGVGYAFHDATKLKSINCVFDLSSVTNTSGMFQKANSLETVRFLENTIKVSISFVNSNLLSSDSIQSIIDGLATVETSQTLTLHATVKSKLTEAQLTQITSKNWTLA